MKLWRITYHNDDTPSGTNNEYFASERKARTRMAELRRDYPLDEEGNPPDGTGFFFHDNSPERIDVPTSKDKLIRWLNSNAGPQ